MENLPVITVFVLILGFLLRATPGGDKILPYYALIAAILGGALGFASYGHNLDALVQGLIEALVASGIYEAGKNTYNIFEDFEKFQD